jgi:hypothetical protein
VIAGTTTALGSGPVTMGDTNTGTNAVVLLSATTGNVVNPITVTTNVPNAAQIGRITSTTLSSGGLTGGVTLNTNLVININTGLGGYSFQVGAISGTGNVTVEGAGHVDLYTTLSFLGNMILATNDSTTLEVDTTTASDINLYDSAGAILYITPGVNTAWNAINGSGEISPSGNNVVVTGTLTVGQGNSNGVFTGQIIDVSGNAILAGSSISVVKTGTGRQVFAGDSSGMLGTNTIQQGTMELDNVGSGSGLPLGPTTVSAGATLDGAGTLEVSNATVEVAGTLLGYSNNETSGTSLTISDIGGAGIGYVEIQSGGALAVNIWSGVGTGGGNGNPACDQVVFNLPLTLDPGAILNVTNRSGSSAFAINDQWQILSYLGAADVTNNFSVTNLPALDPHLMWDAALTGASVATITVVANPHPEATYPASITGVSYAANEVTIQGTNMAGPITGEKYVVLNSTNLLTPIAQWKPVATNSFNANGSFSFTTGAVGTSTNASFFCTKAIVYP